ncbi:hypothetical protein LCGC14_2014260 [marine sediment metagenome]|uniref:Helix-turn-helix domain-containing protein n=1 Tax=marine sediment metagenome TaxID=412755 RepID=A0A0F9HCS0_9ZZZZ
MTTRSPTEKYLTHAEAADQLGLSPMSIWRWLKDGKIHATVIGGHRYIQQLEVDRIKGEVDEAAELLGVDPVTVWGWLKAGNKIQRTIDDDRIVPLREILRIKKELEEAAD